MHQLLNINMEILSPRAHTHTHTQYTYTAKTDSDLSRGVRARDSNLEVIRIWAADLEKMPTPKEGGSSALTAH